MNYVPIDDQLTNVAQIVRKAPKPTLRRAYMRALREWCQQTQWLRIRIPGSTSANVNVYSLGDDPVLDVIAIRAMSGIQKGTTLNMLPSDSSLWNVNNKPDFPRQYCYLVEGAFSLFPTPDDIYSLMISAIVTPKETSTQVPADVLVKYSNDIEAGALGYLLAVPGQPWTDMAAAARYMRDFASSISNGKAEAQRAYNTGSQRVRPRLFLAGSYR